MLDTIAPSLSRLPPVQSDSLLALIALCNADPRPEKIDVGVGVYRDGAGGTPILRSVKAAEQKLWAAQVTKSYLGGRGDIRFAQALRPFVLGRHAGDDRIDQVQTPGGCGALRLGFQLIKLANPDARVMLGIPTWPNHPPMAQGVGLELSNYPYYDRDSTRIRFDEMIAALEAGRSGDVALLHGCCHNPTGADLDAAQWAEVTRVVVSRGLMPFVDLAYQGLAKGLEEDAAGLHGLLDACDEVIVAQSCDKNFGVYRDRVGALFVKTGGRDSTATAMAHVLQMAREMWSMPPDHGGAVVRTVLDDAELAADWHAELGEMRGRINQVRAKIAAADPRLAYIGGQYGMFSMLPLTLPQVIALRERHAIYMADSGRFNVVGMADEALDRFIAAVVEALDA
ncbi:aromatic amino acid transaminase [Sphingomonas sp.]|uniref:amino acid aminotransferase n=1 Tax=Sphingomonas sp. TaxID=28214 RepID=UPI003752E340